MGFFSWKTSDTGESIMNAHSKSGATDVYMYLPDGRVLHEPEYDGYGVFGGVDVYQFIAEYNNIGDGRESGIDAVFKDNPAGGFQQCEDNGIKCPRFSCRGNLTYHELHPPDDCPLQGFFE